MVFYFIIKRFLDILFSLISIIIFSPIFLIVSVSIKLTSRGSICFCQPRVGWKGKIFRTFKFRTMVESAGKDQDKVFIVGEDNRITRVGKFLRKWKIDELPQLMNVLRGEMSLVGPRPELPKYINFYLEEKRKKILSVRPGITSLSSIEFSQEREILTKSIDPERDYIYKILPQKIFLDTRYIEKQSFLVDLLIIIRTIKKILKH